MPKVLIATIPYDHRSGGVKLLYELANTLLVIGIEARIIFFYGSDDQNQNWSWAQPSDAYLEQLRSQGIELKQFQYKDEQKEILENGITIYPDLIKGNPLGGKNIVRYVLNKNDSEFGDDFVLLFSKIFRSTYNLVLFHPLINEYMNDVGALPWYERRMDVTYLGKGPSFFPCERIPGTVLIERTHPKTQEELAIVLRNTRFIFNYDCVTALNFDALMCGVVPVLMHDAQISRKLINEGEIGPYPKIQLDNAGRLLNQDEITEVIAAQKNKLIEYKRDWPKHVNNLLNNCKEYFAMN